MQEMYGLNPRLCNSASTLSGWIEKNKSKVISALPIPISADVIQVLKKF